MQSISRKKSSVRVASVLSTTLLSLGVVGTTATYAKSDNESEGAENGIKHRVAALEDQVADLKALAYPVQVNVDCSLGQTISNALADHELETGPLVIQVSGVCNDTFTISRSNVSIQGQGQAQIKIATGTIFGVTVTDNASHVVISDVTLTGDDTQTAGFLATKGAHLVLKNVVAQDAGSAIMALDAGIIDITGSTVSGNAQGLYAGRNGTISASNTVIESNSAGVLSFKGGVINLTTIGLDLRTPAGPTVVRNNNVGAVARSGGLLELAGVMIQNNQGYGVTVDTGSAVHLFPLGVDGNRITNNVVGGISLSKNASLAANGTTANVITANGRGIVCSNDASYLVPVGFVVTGNLNGDVLGCTP